MCSDQNKVEAGATGLTFYFYISMFIVFLVYTLIYPYYCVFPTLSANRILGLISVFILIYFYGSAIALTIYFSSADTLITPIATKISEWWYGTSLEQSQREFEAHKEEERSKSLCTIITKSVFSKRDELGISQAEYQQSIVKNVIAIILSSLFLFYCINRRADYWPKNSLLKGIILTAQFFIMYLITGLLIGLFLPSFFPYHMKDKITTETKEYGPNCKSMRMQNI